MSVQLSGVCTVRKCSLCPKNTNPAYPCGCSCHCHGITDADLVAAADDAMQIVQALLKASTTDDMDGSAQLLATLSFEQQIALIGMLVGLLEATLRETAEEMGIPFDFVVDNLADALKDEPDGD